VDEAEMLVVRGNFQLVAEGEILHGVKRALEGAPALEDGRYWGASFLRTLVFEDVYRPHTSAEIEALVSPAVRLDKCENYGIFWSNRTTRKRVSEPSPNGREYRWRYSVRKNPKQQWIAIPVPDAGLSRKVVDTVREMVRDNMWSTNKGRRFFELGGMLYCGGCGKKMVYHASVSKGRMYPYYKCRRVTRDGKGACPSGGYPHNHHAETLEERVWESASGLMGDPERLREDLERMIEFEGGGSRGNPDLEMEAWLEKLAEAERVRDGYHEFAAKGLMTHEELGTKLERLEDTRSAAERELGTLRRKKQCVEHLERDKETLLASYARMAPEALEALSAEERHRLYRMLRLRVVANPDRSIEVTGALVPGFTPTETVLR
jgi:hypothetical protein